MSEIGTDYNQLRARISRILALPSDPDNWTTDQTREVDMLIKETCQMVAYPPVVDEFKDHRWTWLTPTTEMSTNSNQQWYLLPEDFDHFPENGTITFSNDDEYYNYIPIVSESFIRKKDYQVDFTSFPEFAAVRITQNNSGAAPERWELGFFPIPNESYRLRFSYVATPWVVNEQRPYPIGGRQHALLYTLAAEAVAERFENDDWGSRYEVFIRQLQTDILRDARRRGQVLGYNGNDPLLPNRSRSSYRRAKQIFQNDVSYGS